jgi:hypothetical protein
LETASLKIPAFNAVTLPLSIVFLLSTLSSKALITEVFSDFNNGASEWTADYNRDGTGAAPLLTWDPGAGVGGSGGIAITPGSSSGFFYGPDDSDYSLDAFNFSDNGVAEPFRASLDFKFQANTFDGLEVLEVGFGSGPGIFFNGTPSVSVRLQFSNENNFIFYFQTRGSSGAFDVVNAPILRNADFKDGHWYRISMAFSPYNGSPADQLALSGRIEDLGTDGLTPGDQVAAISRVLTSTGSSFQAEDEFTAFGWYSTTSSAANTYVAAFDNLAFTDNLEIPLPAPALSNASEGSKQAWSGNSGWVNFKPNGENGVIVSDTHLSGYAHIANCGWMRLGDGMPADGVRYANETGDFGVNVTYTGDLNGYAWSANCGWVNFGWAGTAVPIEPGLIF